MSANHGLLPPTLNYSAIQTLQANAATLQFSLNKGGAGFSGICANFYPQLVAWLCANPKHERATALQRYMAVAENVVMYKYPRCAKVFLGQFEGFDFKPTCRKETVELNEEECLKLEALHATCAEWCAELGIARLNPATGKACTTVPDTLATL
jgi:4-hydroxy-tetrahydrodipicolinate synthase